MLKMQQKQKSEDAAPAPKRKGLEGIINSIDKDQRRKITLIIFSALVILAAVSIIIRAVSNHGSVGSCGSILYSTQKYDCFEQLAISRSNVSICSYLPDNQVQGCVDQIALRGAGLPACKATGNISVANQCIYNVSASTNHTSYCTQISNQSLMSGCIYHAATSGYLSSESYCAEIANSSESSYCSIIYKYDTAQRQRNATYCNALPGTAYSGLPASTLIGSYPKLSNLSFIEAVAFSNLTYNQLCRYSVSYLSGSTANTSIIARPNATNTANLSAICSGANSTIRSSATCYFTDLIDNASASNNPKACLAANNTNYANLCVFLVAYKYHNSTDCGYATDNSIRSICISNTTSSNTTS